MKLRSCIVISILLLFAFISAQAADTSLTEDEKAFMHDLTYEGIPLLFEIPASMKTGFFQGGDNAIPAVADELKLELESFTTKIKDYKLGSATTPLKDGYLETAKKFLEFLDTYSSLISTCGSCVEDMEKMHPAMIDLGRKMNGDLISFYQKSGISPE